MKKYYDSYYSLFMLMFKTTIGLIRGVAAIKRLKAPRVTIFGGTYGDTKEKHAQLAYDLAVLLAQQGISVITGGGPGTMQAANCGFMSVPEQARNNAGTLGISVKGIDASFRNPCSSVIELPTFFARKLLLMAYSDAFVIFPGGIGTVDELFDLLNITKHRIISTKPIFLVGCAYWEPLVKWYCDQALQHEFILPKDARLFRVEDDLGVIRDAIVKHCGQPKDLDPESSSG